MSHVVCDVPQRLGKRKSDLRDLKNKGLIVTLSLVVVAGKSANINPLIIILTISFPVVQGYFLG